MNGEIITSLDNNKVKTEEIISLSDIKKHTNLFKMNKSQSIENIKQNAYIENVSISNSTGDVEFKSNVSNNLTILNSTGDIEIENSNVNGNVVLETSTGDIELTNTNCNKLDIKVTTGDTELVNTIVNTDFKMNGSTGDLNFDNFDATNIEIILGTGNVRGTIKSSKIFIAKSKTGNINVPETYSGGICKIETSTGNINISYK